MNRLLELLRRMSRGFNDDLDQEIRFHIETRAGELEQSGLGRAEANAQARREFGSVALAREESREAWQFRWLEDLAADFRYGLRAIRRNPGFAAAAVLSLAIGIGANTTIFSLTMEFLFSEPSCRDCQSLAAVRLGGNSHTEFPDFRLIREARVFDELAGYREEAEVNWLSGTQSYRLQIMRVTDNFFDVVGVPVLMGRGLRPGEFDSVILNYHFWRNRLNADPLILGRVMIIDGRPHTIVGVLPREHRTVLGFGFSPALYLGVRDERESVALIARRSNGVPRAVLFDRLKTVANEINARRPEAERFWSTGHQIDPVAGFDRLKSTSTIPLAAFFGMLMIVVALVLLIACTNVASLLLARASSRRQELAVRLAIGAGRGRIVRQLLAETLLLSIGGAVAGLLLNVWLTSMMSRIQLPVPVPILLMIEPDWRLLVYAVIIAIGTTLAAGLLPGLRATRADVNSAIKADERQVGHSRWDLRKFLVVGQISVSVLLLATGALFLRNLLLTTAASPGFDVDRLVWASVRLVPERYPQPEKVDAIRDAALERLRSLPGIESAGITQMVPFNDNNRRGTEIRTDLSETPVHVTFTVNRVGPDFFRTMGIPIRTGREFQASEQSKTSNVVILNETFARRVFQDRDPVGHTIQIWSRQPRLIVGVAGDIKHFTMGEDNVLALYEPYVQDAGIKRAMNLHLMLRTPHPEQSVRAIQTAISALDSSAAIEVKPMRSAMGFALLPSRVGASLLGTMGAIGLVLASIGLYGLLAYVVARRIREIGVRVALGASPKSVIWMVFRQSMTIMVCGTAVGVVIAIFAMKPLAMFLVPGLSTSDPLTIIAVTVLLAAVGILATLGPALRALRVDPMTALRYE